MVPLGSTSAERAASGKFGRRRCVSSSRWRLFNLQGSSIILSWRRYVMKKLRLNFHLVLPSVVPLMRALFKPDFLKGQGGLSYLFIGGTNTRYGEHLPVMSSRWGEKSITSSNLVVVSMYATFHKSMKNYDRGPTSHISSRSKHQLITACHVKI